MRDEQRFTVTEDHLKLMRQWWVGWCGDEFGAPEIDPKRPYGNSDVYGDLAEILGVPVGADEPFTSEQRDYMHRLHHETQTALQIALVTGRLEAGEYVAPLYSVAWSRVEARA